MVHFEPDSQTAHTGQQVAFVPDRRQGRAANDREASATDCRAEDGAAADGRHDRAKGTGRGQTGLGEAPNDPNYGQATPAAPEEARADGWR